MSELALGIKWRPQEESLGEIYRFANRNGAGACKTGERVVMSDAKTNMEVTAAQKDELEIGSILDDPGEDQDAKPEEVSIDAASAKSEIIGMLGYASSLGSVEPVFSLMADLLKVPPKDRNLNQDDMVQWMYSNLDKLTPDGMVSVYKSLSKIA